MQPKTATITTILAAAIAGVLLGRFAFTPGHDATPPAAVATAHASAKATAWTCSMHPQIRQDHPGKCPICGMDLIPLVEHAAHADTGPRELAMSPSAVALADIRTTRVERRFPEATVRLVGQLDYDETRVSSLTARFPARIDRLFVNYTGVAVARGEHLARIYSPELVTAQRELLSAHAANPDGDLARLAREKLRLWDLLPEQIDAILARGSVADDFELRAPVGGVVVAKNIKEGDYVKTGEPLFRIADLSELWLHLQAFESDLAKLRYGQEVAFTVEAWPGATFPGRIAFIAPQVDPKTRTVAVRVNVPNPDGRLKPGMFARGLVSVKLAAANEVFAPDLAGKWISPMHPEIVRDGPGPCPICGMPLVPAETLGYHAVSPAEAPLVVPASALLRTGKRAVAYVKKSSENGALFEGREVVLGDEAGSSVIIVSGLSEGDEVVTQGAFKIDSSLQILAKPSMMSADHAPAAMPAMEAPAALTLTPDAARSLLPGYFKLQAALAGDNLAAAKDALRALMQVTGHKGPLPDHIHTVLGAEKMDTLRLPFFKELSDALIAALKQNATAIDTKVVRMHCPMAGDDGADWLQSDENLRNPYFGAEMLTCGDIVETLGGDAGHGSKDEGPRHEEARP